MFTGLRNVAVDEEAVVWFEEHLDWVSSDSHERVEVVPGIRIRMRMERNDEKFKYEWL